MSRSAAGPVTPARRLLLVAAAVTALTGPFLLPTAAMADVDVEGRVVFVADGDTLDVDVFGDGTTTPIRIRSIGVNAMEQTVYSHDLSKIAGACHSTEATKRLSALINGKVVRVTSRYASSKSGARYRRSVDVKIDGVWRDVHLMMMKEGHVLVLPSPSSTARTGPTWRRPRTPSARARTSGTRTTAARARRPPLPSA